MGCLQIFPHLIRFSQQPICLVRSRSLMVLSLVSKDFQFCRKHVGADKQYLLFAPVLCLHWCTLFLETGIFEMPIKSNLCCCPFSHLIPCLVCALYNPKRRQLFLWGSPGEVWLILSRRLLPRVAVYPSHPLVKGKKSIGGQTTTVESSGLSFLVGKVVFFSLVYYSLSYDVLKAESSQCCSLSC